MFSMFSGRYFRTIKVYDAMEKRSFLSTIEVETREGESEMGSTNVWNLLAPQVGF